ncbi:hypothetical protein ACFFLM_26085 [Deinococcus oregonensis]|uniref:Uncharacterized protein n=1 Tax=Deinococcus oregonensis TaxID=1805970 RepID=A0ABV6B6L8_9DEIO
MTGLPDHSPHAVQTLDAPQTQFEWITTQSATLTHQQETGERLDQL